MKYLQKTIALLSGFALATVLFSCSSDDSDTTAAPVVNPPLKELKLSVNFDTIYIGEEIYFKTINSEGQDIEAEVLTAEGTVLKNNKWTPTEAGQYKFIAKKEGYKNSNEVRVEVLSLPDDKTQGKGTFIFKGKTYEIQESHLSLQGMYQDKTSTKQMAGWILSSINNDEKIAALSIFFTPAHLIQGDKYSFELPKKDNILQTSLRVHHLETFEIYGYTRQDVEINLNLGDPNEKNMISGKVVTKCQSLQGEPFSLEYEGQSRIDLDLWDY
ncbi:MULTISPECIES: hypothetical protein [Myroides]|uniref:Carboxypeptidase regulatory-like domain-containing protein n=1 Tax=Myroides albus TaxID=2562892 RepID=A0A6I3LM60_9FLAO|nr:MULTISPECIES: hypothetical protein [Myroides]MTG97075.1 hypothetical protein [Myroides albus]MVX34804.1 hypothetical protein [Myroides sp. LoEW2-1]UVD78502.1 hypothetical protein NWE55_10205 [Myroides albus]